MEAVILTKSYKKDKYNISGFCVVAFDLNSRKLVRFVDEDGAGIPKNALDGKGIDVMDIVSVAVIRNLPKGPQTENLLIDPSTFIKLRKYTLGIGQIIRMIPKLPDDEPKFMDDCRYKYMDVSRFHHSIEIVRIQNLKSDLYQYGEKEPIRYCQFDTIAGHNEKVRITVPGFYNLDYDWIAGDAIAIVTIPMEQWLVGGSSVGYFKFVSALYSSQP